jgi:hypothetical protein
MESMELAMKEFDSNIGKVKIKKYLTLGNHEKKNVS